jgi:hypothetical protein
MNFLKITCTALFLLNFSNLFCQGNSINLDGVDDYITFDYPLLTYFSPNDPWTVEAWIKTTTTNHDVYFSQYFQFNNDRMQVSINQSVPGKVSYWKYSQGEMVISTTDVNDGNWHHIAIVKEGSGVNQLHLYVDGILEDSGIDASAMVNTKTEIGRIDNNTEQRNFPGEMDEIRVWNHALSSSEISNIYDSEFADPESAISCLTAYFQMNENTGNIAADNSGNGHDGLLINMLNNDWVASNAGVNPQVTLSCPSVSNTLEMDGINDYMSLQDVLLPTTSPNDVWSVEAWIKTSTTGDDVYFSQYAQFDSDRMQISVNQTDLGKVSYWKYSQGQIVKSSTSVNDGNWHHIAVVKSGIGLNETHLYVDGILEDVGTDPTKMINTITELGRINNNTNQRNFPGQIDEIRVWHKALNASEIANIYNDEFSDPMNSASCLIANYQMNQQSGHFLSDITGNENTARLMNMSNEDWIPSSAPIAPKSALSCTSPTASISINDLSLAEGNWWGITLFKFQVTRSGTTDACSIHFSTSDGTAMVLDNDYSPLYGNLNWSNGGSDVKFIWVAVRKDQKPEQDENFFVNLTNPINCNLVNDKGEGTILNDDGSFAVANQDANQENEIISKESDLKVFPNPAQNNVTVVGLLMNDEIQIFDCLGRELYNRKVFDNQIQIDISGFEKGFYFIERNTGNKRNRFKFLKI